MTPTPTIVPLSLSIDQVTRDREHEERELIEKQSSKYGYGSDLYKQEILAMKLER